MRLRSIWTSVPVAAWVLLMYGTIGTWHNESMIAWMVVALMWAALISYAWYEVNYDQWDQS